ncbi:hypothetical protein [Bacillus sp. JJ722]|uniref:hypothetical protein n=1 Tax=Bacillus sp. JJ722 TaxID=3122973 RepID=UPI002FFF7E96
MAKISTKIKSSDWRNLPIERWNVASFTAFITDTTREKYGVEYQPGGKGAKNQRWARERGMLKQAQGTYGNAVLRKFIELCWREYTPKAEFPYPTWTFMYSYMDRNFAKAQAEVARANRAQAVPTQDIEEIAEWL